MEKTKTIKEIYMRDNPRASSKIIDVIPEGETVSIVQTIILQKMIIKDAGQDAEPLGPSKSWTEVDYNDQQGWVVTKGLDIEDRTPVYTKQEKIDLFGKKPYVRPEEGEEAVKDTQPGQEVVLSNPEATPEESTTVEINVETNLESGVEGAIESSNIEVSTEDPVESSTESAVESSTENPIAKVFGKKKK